MGIPNDDLSRSRDTRVLRPSPQPAAPRRDVLGRWLMLGTLAALLPLMVVLSDDFGATWDEPPRQRNGQLIFEYYQGKVGLDAFQTDGSRFYGGLFDVTAVSLQQVLPVDRYRVRHALNAVFGWLGVVACAALGARFGGPWMAALAALFAVTAPRYFGHSMNNPKDIPFAALAAWSLFAISGIRLTYPYLSFRLAALAGLAIGLSLSVRPGGVLFLMYAAGALLFAVIWNRESDVRRLRTTACAFVLLAFVATTVPMPFWPWLQLRPYVGLIDAVRGVSNYGWDGVMLFKGREIRATSLPWNYVAVWLLYTTPPVVLAGALLSLGRARDGLRAALPALGMWFAVLFPMAYVIVRGSTLYDGIRQLLFMMPPLFVVAAIGWAWCLSALPSGLKAIAAGVLAVGLLEPVVFQVRNHPNQVVYFNRLLGGTGRAVQRFELDYWGNCYLQAMRQAAAIGRQAGVQVTVSGERWHQMILNAPRVPEVSVTAPQRGRHHFDVELMRGRKRNLVALMARQGDAVFTIATADGAPLCMAFPGPRYAELPKQVRVAAE
jgi:4-amino-4-deoxy-L-arabinose transferase-like glycosyltransferase